MSIPAIKESASVGRYRLGMVAAVAALAAAFGGGGSVMPGGQGLKMNPLHREQRLAERLARRDRLVAKAEAKRARKAARRLAVQP